MGICPIKALNISRKTEVKNRKIMIPHDMNPISPGFSLEETKIICQFILILESIEPGLTWDRLEKRHVRSLPLEIDKNEHWGEWAKYTKRINLRKFMKWLRIEHGYPSDYPDAENLNRLISVMKYPPEVTYSVQPPRKLKPPESIPTHAEIQWLIPGIIKAAICTGLLEHEIELY